MQSEMFELENAEERIFEVFADKQLRLENEVTELEEALKNKKMELRKFQTKDFIDLMSEYNFNSVTLNGYKIEIDNKLYVNEGGANADKIIAFLYNHGAADMLHESVIIENAVKDDLLIFKNLGYDATMRSKFNIASLKAFIGHLRYSGENVDLASLGIYEEIKTIIKKVK